MSKGDLAYIVMQAISIVITIGIVLLWKYGIITF